MILRLKKIKNELLGKPGNSVAVDELLARLDYFRSWLHTKIQSRKPTLLSSKANNNADSAGVSCSFQELLNLRNEIHALFLSPPNAFPQDSANQFISAFRGRGLEYDTARHYHFGDEVRHIDWRVTARTLKTHVKVYHEERERPVCFLVDHSQSMHFATRNEYKAVRASKTSALLVWLAKELNEKVGGIVFDEDQQHVFKPVPGDNGVLPLLKCLQIDPVDRVKQENTPEQAQDVDQPLLLTQLQRFNHLAPRGSLCFVVSDFYALEPGNKTFENVLYDLSQRCDVNLLLIYDPFEAQALPAGRYRLSDGQALLEVNNSPLQQRQHHSELFKQRLNTIEKLSKQAGFNAHAIATDAALLEVLNFQLSAVPGITNFNAVLGQ